MVCLADVEVAVYEDVVCGGERAVVFEYEECDEAGREFQRLAYVRWELRDRGLPVDDALMSDKRAAGRRWMDNDPFHYVAPERPPELSGRVTFEHRDEVPAWLLLDDDDVAALARGWGALSYGERERLAFKLSVEHWVGGRMLRLPRLLLHEARACLLGQEATGE